MAAALLASMVTHAFCPLRNVLVSSSIEFAFGLAVIRLEFGPSHIRKCSSNPMKEINRKNHNPLLKEQVEMGRMLSAATPRYHTTEDGRWDYRVTIVFKNAAVANDGGFDEEALIKQFYPDQETYKKKAQRRFEILDAHWDLPIKDVDLNSP